MASGTRAVAAITDRQDVIRLLKETVRPDAGTIPPYVLTHPEVYKLELEKIFGKTWLYVAHESEIPAKGDYVTRRMGEQSVIVARGEDNSVRVMLNMCRHRGMQVCRSDLGNSSHFRCPYHGFTYKNTGECIGVPFQKDAYGDALDKADLGLVPARVDTYKGLIFSTWNWEAPSLSDYLGDMKWYLDLVAGRSNMVIVGPPHRWEVATTWKLPAENFMSDAYHTSHTHASIAKVGLAPGLDFAKLGYHIHAGNGHGLGLGGPGDPPIFAQELLPEFERNLSPEQFQVLKQMKNCHGNVFPNLSFLISLVLFKGKPVSLTTLRQWQPKGPGKIEAFSWFLVEADAPEEWRELSRQAYIHTFGTSGTFEQDDTENWTDISANTAGLAALNIADKFPFDYTMGMQNKPITTFPGPGEVYDGKYSEANARAFYRRWLELITDGE